MTTTKTVTATCAGCGNMFSVRSRGQRRIPKYCSRECFCKTGFQESRDKAYATLALKNRSTESHKIPRTQICEACGSLIDCKPSRKRRFCSIACSQSAAVRYFYKEERTQTCRKCGILIDKAPSLFSQFCSNDCFRSWKSEHPELYKKPRTQKCKRCGIVIDIQPSSKRQFCGPECASLFARASSTEKGKTLKWQRIYARDLYSNKCCRCGYDSFPEILQVHHKDFNPRNQSKDNILLLCPNCHETEHFVTKTGRFGLHIRNKKKAHEDTYKFKRSASMKRLGSISVGDGDPGPNPNFRTNI